MLYINNSGKYIEINFNMKIPFPYISELLLISAVQLLSL